MEFPVFMTQNPFRLQLLGRYHSNSEEVCYDYVLHKHFNKNNNISMNMNVSSLTWSMVICPSDNINGTVSVYLTKVIVDGKYNSNSYYYIDDIRFCYHLTGIDESFNESQIALCFNNNKNRLSDRQAETVTEAHQFCFYFGDEEEEKEQEKEGIEAIRMSPSTVHSTEDMKIRIPHYCNNTTDTDSFHFGLFDKTYSQRFDAPFIEYHKQIGFFTISKLPEGEYELKMSDPGAKNSTVVHIVSVKARQQQQVPGTADSAETKENKEASKILTDDSNGIVRDHSYIQLSETVII